MSSLSWCGWNEATILLPRNIGSNKILKCLKCQIKDLIIILKAWETSEEISATKKNLKLFKFHFRKIPLVGVGKWDWARAEVGKPVRMLFEPFRLFLVL